MMPSMAGRSLRVLLVDDHEVVREGIRTLLQADEDIVVVAEAESARAAVAAADQHRPDVVVMDVVLADGSGIEATREIRARHAEIRVLMLTASDDHQALFSSIMAGACGYVLKRVKGNELVTAVRAVGEGRNLIDPALTGALLDRVRAGGDPLQHNRLTRLSAQESRILALIAEGLTNGEIGTTLSLAEKTVRNYVSSILGKLEVTRRSQAAAYLARRSAGPVDR
jgi:two-component system, NarL family, response regulator DevR